MFRIVEIFTFPKPEAYIEAESLELPDMLRAPVNVARYQSVMKVLKPGKYFKLVSSEVPDNFFRLPDLPSLPDINISAVVGENGMGKSSLVELMIRLINNVVYALKIGLEKFGDYSLRFVGDIYACMKFETDDGCFCIVQRGDTISFNDENSRRTLWEYQFFERKNESFGLRFGHKLKSARQLRDDARMMLSRLFYTISVNYSAYGYNVLDLQPEYTPDSELERNENPDTVDDGTRIWMHGIFHKNDSYQLPLVLTPYRSSGNINYNNERNLNRDRLCRLALLDSSPLNNVLDDKIPYSIVFDINNRFSCYPQFSKNGVRIVSFGLVEEAKWLYKSSEQDEFSRKDVQKFGHLILDVWTQATNIDLVGQARMLNNKSHGDGDRALSYLVYKTLKIPSVYNRYKPWSKTIQDMFDTCRKCEDYIGRIDMTLLLDYIKKLLSDSTHVTLKLRRILALLIFQHYKAKDREVLLKDFNDIIISGLHEQNDIVESVTIENRSPLVHLWNYDELMPGPSVNSDVRFLLRGGGRVVFSLLSSGERQLVSVLSATVYHIYNLSTLFVENDASSDTGKTSILRYPYINIIFDEAELYFHPKYQSQFINALLRSIAGLKISGVIKGINMIFATHSPFLLSDIPKGNVLCLHDGEPSELNLDRTFCANVYDILANNFFMNRFVGDFAMAKVQDIIDRIDRADESVDSVAELKMEIELIGDDFVRMSLKGRFQSKFSYLR